MADFSKLSCEQFQELMLSNPSVTVNVNGEPLDLKLWAVVGEGDGIYFLFRGPTKARFSIGLCYEKFPVIKEAIEEAIKTSDALAHPVVSFIS